VLLPLTVGLHREKTLDLMLQLLILVKLMVQLMRHGKSVGGPQAQCGLFQQGESMRLRHELQFGSDTIVLWLR
jgi:hypothetical protein